MRIGIDSSGRLPDIVAHDFVPEFKKTSGHTVPATGFLDETWADVSAVLFSQANVGDVYLEGRQIGYDYCLLHNPNACVAVPRGRLPAAAKEWLGDPFGEWSALTNEQA